MEQFLQRRKKARLLFFPLNLKEIDPAPWKKYNIGRE